MFALTNESKVKLTTDKSEARNLTLSVLWYLWINSSYAHHHWLCMVLGNFNFQATKLPHHPGKLIYPLSILMSQSIIICIYSNSLPAPAPPSYLRLSIIHKIIQCRIWIILRKIGSCWKAVKNISDKSRVGFI